MSKKRSPNQHKIQALIFEIKAINDAAKFPRDAYERESLLADKCRLQSELLRDYGEYFEILLEQRGLIGILSRDGGPDACHARIESLDADIQKWIKQQLGQAR
jgi:hypothetical protein